MFSVALIHRGHAMLAKEPFSLNRRSDSFKQTELWKHSGHTGESTEESTDAQEKCPTVPSPDHTH